MARSSVSRQEAQRTPPIEQYLFNEIVSKKLTRRNWLSWKVRLFALLKDTPGAEEILLSDEPNNNPHLDHQLFVALLSCVETDDVESVSHVVLAELVAGRKTARQIFKALEDELATVKDSVAELLQERIQNLQLHGNDVRTLIHKLDEVWLDATLVNKQSEFDDTHKIHHLTTKCQSHDKYSQIIDILLTHFPATGHTQRETLKRMELRLRISQSRSEMEESRRALKTNASNAAARSREPTSTPSAAQSSCESCGRRNHVTSQCRTRPKRIS